MFKEIREQLGGVWTHDRGDNFDAALKEMGMQLKKNCNYVCSSHRNVTLLPYMFYTDSMSLLCTGLVNVMHEYFMSNFISD